MKRIYLYVVLVSLALITTVALIQGCGKDAPVASSLTVVGSVE